MTTDDSPEMQDWVAQLKRMEAAFEVQRKRLEDFREFVREQRLGKPLPSPKSNAERVAIAAIKPFLASRAPATRQEIIDHLMEQWADGRVALTGNTDKDRIANINRSITKCLKAGTIIQDGEMYRLP